MPADTIQSSPLLAGRRILVTGAARGLGFAFAEAMCRQGARVALADLRREQLDASVRQLRERGFDASGFEVDVSSPEAIERCADDVVKTLGGLDGLLNNAAVTDSGGKGMDDIAIDKWDQVMTVNVRGVWLMTKACRAALRESGRGAVVNLASDTAMWGAPNLMAYVASKGAVMAMTRSMAREMGPDNITVNAIAPGLVLVEATQYVPEARHQLYVDQRALQRQQTPEDVSGAAVYAMSDGARFVTGQVLAVNGGFVMN
ncbi:SDR family oxidoreductase [Diaphorobacter ruginosibacter]|jgi:NAD(P)-dependent dehydrogenase (short-subunit alcohol dehydrogenase family)|uniref:SDR family oxidoreductase n=1 Tax=Diaphorobacter ruginosibacter TaxID=1715720 RepID=A0A7G9RIH2_9BURK|nr:SDR family oxidoreductase [Diaphorobacter ruginosibacter]MDR2335195.1 SDR family oxidoreductase [Burkholderiaceae bacterium]QNN55397.1 SDR family oxidoreductase [Diaphorobacter ruginosibacter]